MKLCKSEMYYYQSCARHGATPDASDYQSCGRHGVTSTIAQRGSISFPRHSSSMSRDQFEPDVMTKASACMANTSATSEW